MSSTVIILGAVGALVSSLVGAAVALYTSRATNRKLNTETTIAETKLPAEVDTIIAQAADTAVLAMDKVIKAQAARIDELTKAREQDARERTADRRRMAELEQEVAGLRAKVATAEQHLAEARTAGERLAAQLRDALAEQDRRKH